MSTALTPTSQKPAATLTERLGIFDKAYAQATAGSTDELRNVSPDVFTAEIPLGTYQGLDEQVYLPKSPGSYRTVLVPRGSSKPEWLETK